MLKLLALILSPPTGTHPVRREHLGMKEAILVVMRSHEPGKEEDKTVKYGTAWTYGVT